MGERRRGHGRRASRQAFQSGGAGGEGEILKKPHPSTPNGAGRGASPRPGTKRRGALTPVAASVLPHRRGRGRLRFSKGAGGPSGGRARRRLAAAAGREGAALGPARPGAQRARRGEGRPPQRRTRRPGPRPRRPPRLREKARRAGRRQRLQARSSGGRRRTGRQGGRAPRPDPGGGVAVSAEGSRARGETVLKRGREGKKKKSKHRPREDSRGRLPGCLLVTQRPPRADGRHESQPPSGTPPPPPQAAAVASGADQLRPRPEPRHNK